MAAFAQITPMNSAQAEEYLAWHYPPPYEFYNTPPQALAQVRQEIHTANGMDYYAVLDDTGAMTGMFEYAFHSGVMEIGLGLPPPLCGRGLGAGFVRQCIEFGRRQYAYAGPITLRVAEFNKRALRLYQGLGFAETGRQQANSFGTPVTFICMALE